MRNFFVIDYNQDLVYETGDALNAEYGERVQTPTGLQLRFFRDGNRIVERLSDAVTRVVRECVTQEAAATTLAGWVADYDDNLMLFKNASHVLEFVTDQLRCDEDQKDTMLKILDQLTKILDEEGI